MNATTVRKKRLEQLLDLAQAYKGWSRKELAAALGRDPTKLVPGTGIPKLDFVVELAAVLDWPVGEVAGFLWSKQPHGRFGADGADFDSLNTAAGEAHRAGRYELALGLARRAYGVAATPEQRARACNRESGALDGLGRYTEVLQAIKQGMQEVGVAPEFRRMLQSNLANAYYSLWALVESGSIAARLLDWYAANPPESKGDRKTQAFAHYVAGHTDRRAMCLEPDRAPELAVSARQDLQRACDLYSALASEYDDPSLAGIANTCYGGLLEAEVALGRRTATEVLDELSVGLDRVRDVAQGSAGDQLESYGWWSIFGCNIALRHIDDERELQQRMAVLTNKADEIADRLDNWSMRERVFTMQHLRWERAQSSTGFDIPCVIDTDDVRVIAGTMGRFPTFRDTGWRILQSAQVVDGN
ncbi:MAG: hypothetical protein ACYSU7_01575 [Planctomycetota bacterium]|jgi:hypothetical protein